MASNRTGKTSSDDTTQKLSSTVPNDYRHLGVPGSLNMPLANSKRRTQARRGRGGGMPGWLKALLAMGGGLLAFGIVMLVIFIIAFPPFFRNLEPRYQQRLINIFPPFDSLRPTVPFKILPTLSGANDSAAAQDLLLTPEQMVNTPQPQVTDLSQSQPLVDSSPTPGGATPTPTVTPTATGGIPIGMETTPQPTPLPVYVPPTQQNAAVPIFTPVIPPTEVPLPAAMKLDGIRYEQQGWNNCGPTTLTMALSYYGWTHNEDAAARWLKPDPEDKNVSPWQIVRFVNDPSTGVFSQLGVKALYRIGGNVTLIKRLLAAGFPVMIEESIQPAGEDWMGHYVLMMGYDDSQQHFLTFDSYLGSNQQQGRPSPYMQFDNHWRDFNRVFIVIYKPDREMDLRAALGPFVDPTYGYQTSLEISRDEASKDREDAWAWFNMGTAYTMLKDYYHAATAYDEAFRIGLPWRMLWYQFGPYEAYFYTGRYNDVLLYAQATIATTPYVEESFYWQGMAYAAQGDTSAAISKFNLALNYNYNFFPAQDARSQVEAGTFTVASVSGS